MIAENINIVHLIQLSVAPVFLLAGVAGLLNVFTNRLTRVIDRLEKIDDFIHEQEANDENYIQPDIIKKRREFLVMRMQNTNWAIFFCTSTGLMVAMVIISVFLTALFSFDTKFFISILFIIKLHKVHLSKLFHLFELQ